MRMRIRIGWIWIKDSFKRLTADQVLSLIFELVIVIATLSYAIIAYFQLTIISGQLTQMKDSSQQTDQLIAATNEMATSYTTNLEVNREAIRDSTEATRRDQRAWVGTTGGFKPQEAKPNIKQGWGARITNTGRTPARNLTAQTNARILPAGEPFIPIYPKNAIHQGNSILYPGVNITLTAPAVEFSQRDFDCARDGTCIFYVFGKFTYNDVFNKAHWGTFCLKLEDNLFYMNACNTYNDGD